jgi:hypothetical protein
MPNRWVCLLIVGCWLATTGWLFWTEILPDLVPGQPPPFTIDLLDELPQNNSTRGEVLWDVYQTTPSPDDKEEAEIVKSHMARTWVRRWNPDQTPPDWLKRPLPDECFEIGIHFQQLPKAVFRHQVVEIGELDSFYYVTPEGQLLAKSTSAKVTVHLPGWPALSGEIVFTGEVKEGQFLSRYRLVGAEWRRHLGDRVAGELPPVAVSHHGSVLDPMQPVTRIRNVKPGQAWDMPLVDPLAEALAAALVDWFGLDVRGLLGLNSPRRLKARVLPEVQVLNWHELDVQCELQNSRRGGRKQDRFPAIDPKRCLVIEYQGKDASARTWVMEETGLVLRQEATVGGMTWAFERISGIGDQ